MTFKQFLDKNYEKIFLDENTARVIYEGYSYIKNMKILHEGSVHYCESIIDNYQFRFEWVKRSDSEYENKFAIWDEEKKQYTYKLQKKFVGQSGTVIKILSFNLSFMDNCLAITKPDKWYFCGDYEHYSFYESLFNKIGQITGNKYHNIQKYETGEIEKSSDIVKIQFEKMNRYKKFNLFKK